MCKREKKSEWIKCSVCKGTGSDLWDTDKDCPVCEGKGYRIVDKAMTCTAEKKSILDEFSDIT